MTRHRCERSQIRHQRQLRARDEGAVAVIVAVSITALLALAALTVDAGAYYSERRQMQTAADAAALAGVQDLPSDPGTAVSEAQNYASVNSPEADSNDFEIGATYVSNDTITAQLSNPDMGLFFARILGIDTAHVQARAKAIVGSPTAYGSGVMPYGILARGMSPPYGLENGEDTILHTDPHGSSKGNFRTVDLSAYADASGGGQVGKIVEAGGSNKPISIGTVINTQTGDAWNPQYTAFNDYFTCNHSLADLQGSYDPDKGVYTLTDSGGHPCRRFITCPVIVIGSSGSPSYDWESAAGNTSVTVIGFANYFIESVTKKEPEFRGRFVQVVDPDALDGGGYVDWAGVRYWLEE